MPSTKNFICGLLVLYYFYFFVIADDDDDDNKKNHIETHNHLFFVYSDSYSNWKECLITR